MDDSSQRSPRSISMKSRIVGLIVVLGVVTAFAIWMPAYPEKRSLPTEISSVPPENSTNSEMTEVNEPEKELELPQEPVAPDQLTKEQIDAIVVGTWHSQYYGERHLIVREDQTATIYYQANMMARMFVGSHLRIEYSWRYDPEKKQVIFTITGGGPESGLDYVKKTWGDDLRQTVESICVSDMYLADLDGKTKHHWSRLTEVPEKVMAVFEK